MFLSLPLIRKHFSRKFVFLDAVLPLLGVQLSNNLVSVRAIALIHPSNIFELTSFSTEGSSVAVSLGVVATSAFIGASSIIAVDTNPGKESWAKKMGATQFINPTTLPEGKKIQEHLVEITDGGLDFTFDATGNACFLIFPMTYYDQLIVRIGPCHACRSRSLP
jgi:hypothetical protein